MKTLLIYLSMIGLFAMSNLSAQIPQAFKYQAAIRDTAGQVLQNKLISLRISILQGDMEGEEVYSEIHDVWTDQFGLVSLNIGQGFDGTREFSSIPWGEDTFFLQVEMDMDGATNYHLLGTSQLMAVPYALYAESAGNELWKTSENGISYSDGKVGIGSTETSSMLNIEHPGQTGGNNKEVLFEGRISDAPDDFIKIYNGTGNNQQFMPSIWGHHQSDRRAALYLIGTISQEMDYGNWPVTIFASRTYNGEWGYEDVQNRPLFSWRGVFDDKMTMLANGFLGIGTTNPNTLVHLEGASDLYEGRNFLTIKNNSNDEVSAAAIKIISGNGFSSTVLQHNAESYQWEGRSDLGILWNDGKGLLLAATSDSGDIRFETGGAGLEKERLRVTENGKVGIGTTNPQRKLHINDVMRIEPRYTPPENPSEGDIYMDGNEHVLKVFDGTEWKACW